ncbi:MAG: T9SS type A sorting domain-containing protein [Bacteroidales bacterium]|nr:T9SS type A sorting domain-containing protein [Bacteroidales bacterium]
MVKFITKTVCMAFIAALCVGNLFAQTGRGSSQVADTQQETDFSVFSDFRGGGDPAMIHNINGGAARKGTVDNPYGSQVGTTPGIQATEYIEGELYGVNYSGGNNFGKINQSTGAWTLIKSAFASDAASIAHNPVDGKTYCFPWTGDDALGSVFGTVDLATGNVTTIATFPKDGNNTFYAAIDEDGTCYAVRNLTQAFGTINLATGAFTQIATIPYSVNFISDMSFDRETGELYWLGRSSDFGGEGFSAYFKVNKTTGVITQIVGPNAPGVNCFSILNWYVIDDCPAVTDLQVEKQGTDVKLTWTAAEGNPTGYIVYNGAAELGTVTVTEYFVKDLADGSYTFGVEAIYDEECEPVQVTIPVTILIGDPVKNFNGTCVGGTLVLAWEEPDGEVTHYDIYQNDVHFAEVAAPATGYGTTDLEDETHTYCVVAVYDNEAQSKKVCKEIECVPPTCDKVTGAKAEITDCETVTITWEAVEGATYKVNDEAVETNAYTETGEFEHGKIYKWNITTICENGLESEPVEVSATADCPTAINELGNSVAIYPNPTSNNITITAANFAKVEIYNTVGQLVETKTVPTFNVATYNAGIYFFKVYDTNNNSVTKRVMVTK